MVRVFKTESCILTHVTRHPLTDGASLLTSADSEQTGILDGKFRHNMAKSNLLAFDVVVAGTKYSLGEMSGLLC